MNDGLLVEIKYLAKRLEITSLIEVVADPKALQILVAVELFIVGVGHLRELCFVLFIKDSHGVATEIGPRHGNDVSLGLRHERMDCLAHDVRIIGRRMVELVNGNNGLIKLVRQLDLLKGKAEGRMRADQVMRVRVLHELHDLIDLAGIARRTQVVLRIHMPVGEEAECRQVGVLKGTADGHFRHSHKDCVPNSCPYGHSGQSKCLSFLLSFLGRVLLRGGCKLFVFFKEHLKSLFVVLKSLGSIKLINGSI